MNTLEDNSRNFKDFLLVYNSMSERCFNSCIVDLSSRNLEESELSCVEHCAEKYIKLNHKIMALYVDSQQALLDKNMKELQKQNELQSSNQITDHKNESIEQNAITESVRTTDVNMIES